MLELVEIQKIVLQGMTKPVLCKGSDGKTYYAKGKQATASGLIKEWMAANLAKELSLPLPNFHIAYIDNLLVESFGQEAVDCLGSGYVFVSERIESATDFKYHLLNEISPQLQKTILLFDLWIENEDRTLSKEYSGNPNLLWQSSSKQPYIIDHNLAFDTNFNLALFKETHIFQSLCINIQRDYIEDDDLRNKLLNSLSNWQQWWHKIPQEWQEQNEDTKLFCPKTTLQRLKAEAQGDIWLKL